jgi:hypothetical protein
MSHQHWSCCVCLMFCLLAACETAGPQTVPNLAAKPENLGVFVYRVQRQYVRLSVGELAHECFTDADLRRFEKSGVVAKVTAAAKGSAELAGIAAALKALPRGEQTRWLEGARRHYHPTWAELGRIARDGSGQSWAGQRAERAIALAIVAVVEEIMAAETNNAGDGAPMVRSRFFEPSGWTRNGDPVPQAGLPMLT